MGALQASMQSGTPTPFGLMSWVQMGSLVPRTHLAPSAPSGRDLTALGPDQGWILSSPDIWQVRVVRDTRIVFRGWKQEPRISRISVALVSVSK